MALGTIATLAGTAASSGAFSFSGAPSGAGSGPQDTRQTVLFGGASKGPGTGQILLLAITAAAVAYYVGKRK